MLRAHFEDNGFQVMFVQSAVWYLFDWRGRIGRIAFLGGLLATAFLEGLVWRAFPAPLVIFLVHSVSVLITLSLESKRLHDLGRSALWILWMSIGITFWAVLTFLLIVTMPSLSGLRAGANSFGGALFLGSSRHWMFVGFALPILIKMGWLIFFPAATATMAAICPIGRAALEMQVRSRG
jgi:uncharacterized membrane protein YhaH (DUF805 family)